MSDKESAQNVIDAYRRRQQAARKVPLIFVIAMILAPGRSRLIGLLVPGRR